MVAINAVGLTTLPARLQLWLALAAPLHHLNMVNAARYDFASTTSHALPTTAVVNNVADSDETLEPI